MKKIVVFASAALLLVSFATSCKPKQSAYRQAYEQAKQREVAAGEQGENTATTAMPVQKAPDRDIAVRQERITALEGENESALNRYSVVVGAFQNHANAQSLKERLQADGYSPILVQNEQGMLRVIIASYPTREEAASGRDAVKTRFTPLYQDAWLLERTN